MPIYKKINTAFFQTWSPDMAYILGWLYADGTILCTKRNTWFWSLQITDRDVLEYIKKTLRAQHMISKKKRILPHKQQYRFQVGSKDMCEDLMRIGLTPNKSKRMRFPNVPEEYFGDFVRGYFDGDGGVWVGDVHVHRKISTRVILTTFTSGSRFFLVSLQKKLKSHGLRGGSLVKKQGGFDLKYSVADSFLLYEIMYTRLSFFCLIRKKKRFDAFWRQK